MVFEATVCGVTVRIIYIVGLRDIDGYFIPHPRRLISQLYGSLVVKLVMSSVTRLVSWSLSRELGSVVGDAAAGYNRLGEDTGWSR